MVLLPTRTGASRCPYAFGRTGASCWFLRVSTALSFVQDSPCECGSNEYALRGNSQHILLSLLGIFDVRKVRTFYVYCNRVVVAAIGNLGESFRSIWISEIYHQIMQGKVGYLLITHTIFFADRSYQLVFRGSNFR